MSTALSRIRVAFSRQSQPLDVVVSDSPTEERVPPPKYRHAAPSAPWPWMDFKTDAANVAPLSPGAYEPWARYPQSHFGNWTPDQVQRCRMLTICQNKYPCKIHKVDVLKNGEFYRPEEEEVQHRSVSLDQALVREYWNELQNPLDSKFRLRALFIEDITLDVLRVFGARYNIEPFFFASSANWIPSRFQEDPQEAKGDHITVVLPFIRVINNEQGRVAPTPPEEIRYPPGKGRGALRDSKHTIDTQAPLVLSDEKILLQDLLAMHMVRNTTENVIISYHHHSTLQRTTAQGFQSLVQRTGDSVYWSKIYKRSRDPTFVFLAALWYALYAWDEALEVLYAYLSEQLEGADVTTHIEHTRELHKLQAHLLYYQQLLRDFKKSVEFVRDTPNPAMDEDPDRESSKELLKLETENLLTEIERLKRQILIQSDRLSNAMALSFSTVNIEDSKVMQELTKATMRDSAAMKQISYLTLIFLPANFLASVFGMNVAEINPNTLESLASYVESTIILMAITAWVVIALQDPSPFHPGGRQTMKRIAWPVFYCHVMMKGMIGKGVTRPTGNATDKRQDAGRNLA